MSIRRRGCGSRARITAWAATACTAVAALLSAAPQSASAFQPCPTWTVAPDIAYWETVWPTPGANPKGVTQCLANKVGAPAGYLQIVDLYDGAKMRLISQVDESSWDHGADYPNTFFKKRTAEDWFTYIKESDDPDWDDWTIPPDPALLFSTTNGSFFKDSDNDHETPLPFPHMYEQNGTTSGLAGGDPDDPDHHAPKRSLRIGLPDDFGGPTPQTVKVDEFPTYYDWFEAYNFLADFTPDPTDPHNPRTVDATVGFDPEFPIGDEARRNYIGTFGNRVYIFTSMVEYTNAEANHIMQQIQPGMSVMQLDGGGSAQTYSQYGSFDSSVPFPFPDREVPDVLAVYKAP